MTLLTHGGRAGIGFLCALFLFFAFFGALLFFFDLNFFELAAPKSGRG